jgi:oligoribonuclease NrnB/cAMP/cGMP phosphodiesterase (DHH superfamily)
MRLIVPYNADNYTELCIFHRADMDGRGSGAIVNIVNIILERHVFFYGANYEADFSIEKLLSSFPRLKNVFIVDYSISVEDTIKILSKGINVIWCDHHETAKERYDLSSEFKIVSRDKNLDNTDIIQYGLSDKYKYPGKFYGYFSHQYSGAMITYSVLSSVFDGSDEYKKWYKNLGIVMDTISTYDTWNQTDTTKWNTALTFNMVARDYDFTPYSLKWMEIANDINVYYNILKEGSVIARHDEISNKINAGAYAGTLYWKDKCFCTMNDMRNSLALNSVFDPSIHDACLFFKFNPKEKGFKDGVEVQGVWKVTLFSNDLLPQEKKDILDLTTIVKEYGGGGHRCACGFSCVDLPFDIHDIKPIYKKTL